jgi:hypothetical protein
VLSLQIVEQPPEKSVYKRNLKPNPTVMIVGEQKYLEGNLYIAPTLIRCDTFTEEDKYLTGNRPVKVTSGRVLTFRKLKITTTSHQQQETLFCLKFELRRYTSEDEFEVLDAVYSNPLSVLSHSTQMKPGNSLIAMLCSVVNLVLFAVSGVTPTISEVIPNSGPSTGGTRVAILGNNFIDSPASRIRFGEVDVMPHIFHGTGTLICHTPQHAPATVAVRVCNSNKKWSDTSAPYVYEEQDVNYMDSLQVPYLYRQNNNNNSGLSGTLLFIRDMIDM